MRIRQSRRLPRGTKFLIGAFTLSGTVHLAKPDAFYALIPPALGSPMFWTVASGAVELICAVALFKRFWWAPYLAVATLAIVWVGNWWMAYDLLDANNTAALIVAVVRLPLQIPLMVWAWRTPTR